MLLFKRVIRELSEFNSSSCIHCGAYTRKKKINSGLYKFEDFFDIPSFFLNATGFLITPKNSEQQPANRG